jgi:diguanylate cyclase (GGDEF)-like protein
VERRETGGVTIRLIVAYVRAEAGVESLPRLLELAGETRTLEELDDEHRWSTYEQKVALLAAAARLLGQPDVAVRIGHHVLNANVAGSLKLLLNLVGSPAQLLRGIARTCQKFTTAATMTADEVTATSAVITYRLLPGYEPNRYDCELNIGLLAQASALFGLPPSAVEHVQCQVLGSESCVYRLRWQRRSRLRRRRQTQVSGQALADRLDALQATVAELVTVSSLDDVLRHVAAGARRAVNAPQFLLVATAVEVLGAPRQRPQVFGEGMSQETADRLAAELLDTGRITSVDGEVLIVPVRSARHDYGWLVGLGFADDGFLEREPELLRAYGGLAAAALDVVGAQQEAVQQRDTAEVLLSLAGALLQADTEAEVAAITAEHALSVIGSERASVLLWDDVAQELTVAGHAGWGPAWEQALAELVVRPSDTEALARTLLDPGPSRFWHRDTADAGLRAILDAFGTPMLVTAQMESGGRLLGVLVGAWTSGPARTESGEEHLLRRLRGMSDQASGSLQRARLLQQVRVQATSDELTGLTNRRGVTDRLAQVLAHDRGAGHALLYLDLDSFKAVNDSVGHAAGDALLRRVAGLLETRTRAGSLVARLGGDEFVVLLDDVEDEADVAAAASRLALDVDAGLDEMSRGLGVRVSLGFVLLDHDSVRDVLHDADLAMYRTKRSRRALTS